MKTFGEVPRFQIITFPQLFIFIITTLALGVAEFYNNEVEDVSAKIVPLSYTLRILPDFNASKASAQVTIQAKVVKSSNLIELNEKFLQIDLDAVTVTNLNNGRVMDIISQSIETGRYPQFPPNRTNLYIIELKESFQIGDNLSINVPYTMEITESWESGGSYGLFGAFCSTLFVDKHSSKTMNDFFGITTLAPYRTRELFPLVDDPDSKSKFTIILGRPVGEYQSVTNMELSRTEANMDKEGYLWDHFEETVPLSPQHLFFLQSNFVNYTIYVPEDDRYISVWSFKTYHERNKEKAAFISTAASQLLKLYEKTFQMKYPSKELKIVRLPSHSYITSKAYYSVIVFDKTLGSDFEETTTEKDIISTLAGDIARQWLGVIIHSTHPVQFSMSFLTDGLTQYVKSWGIQHILPNYPREELINWENARYPENRLATLLLMLEDMLGRPIMEKAIAIFVDKCKSRLAEDDDLYDAIQISVEQNNAENLLPSPDTKIKEIITDWLHFPREEYPIVEVNRGDDCSTLTISQKAFDPYKDMFGDEAQFFPWIGKTRGENSTWFLPVKILTGDGYLHKFWLNQNTSTFSYSDKTRPLDTTKLIMVNPSGVPIFRTIYDSGLTQLLKRQLTTDPNTLSASGRLQLLNDYLFFAHRFPKDKNFTFVETTLEMIKYLGKETSDSVWVLVIHKLVDELVTRFQEDAEAFQDLQSYFVPKLSGLIDRIGKSITEKIEWGRLQQVCLQLHVPSCVKSAKDLLAQWQQNPEAQLNTIYPSSASVFVLVRNRLCAVLSEEENPDKWNFVFSQVRNRDASETADDYNHAIGNFHFEQRELLAGLACSKNTEHLSQLLQESLKMRNETRFLAFVAVANRPELRTKELMYEFLKENVRSQQISPYLFQEFISQLAFSKRLKPEMGEDLQQFIDSNTELLEPVRMWLNESIATFNRCSSCDWWLSTGVKVKSWLSHNI